MAHLNNVNFDCVGIRFLNLIKTPFFTAKIYVVKLSHVNKSKGVALTMALKVRVSFNYTFIFVVQFQLKFHLFRF